MRTSRSSVRRAVTSSWVVVAGFGVGKGATFLATDGTENDEVVFGIVDTESEGGEEEEGATIEVCEESAAGAVAVFP